MVACSFSYHIHRSAFAFGNLAYVVDGLLVNQQAHTFLRFVGDDFLGRQGFVTDRQFVHVNQTTAFLYQLRQTVDMTGRTVVVDRYDRIFILFTQCAHYVVRTFLHFSIGTLYGVQLDTR